MHNLNILYPEPTTEGESPQIPAADVTHFAATVNRALYLCHGDNVEKATVQLGVRSKPKTTTLGVVYDEGGWLEHHIIINYIGGRQLVVGAIQRKAGNDSEFHS